MATPQEQQAAGGFLGQLGNVLLGGLQTAIDGEAVRRYGIVGGQVYAQGDQGNLTPVGTPFRDTVSDVIRNPWNVAGLVAVVVLGVVLVRRL